jgi:hypothetical protein
MLSAEYGWTPSQIDKENFNELRQYVEIINEKRRIENSLLKQQQ